MDLLINAEEQFDSLPERESVTRTSIQKPPVQVISSVRGDIKLLRFMGLRTARKQFSAHRIAKFV